MGAFVGYVVPSMHELEAAGPGGTGGAKGRRGLTLGVRLGF
jgi:hypothetical protein